MNDLQSFETLFDFLKSCFPDKNVKESVCKDLSTQGMASTSKTAVLTFDDPGSEDVKVFIKICQKGSQSENFNNWLHTFDKEISFYKDILPELIKFERLKYDDKQSRIENFTPEFYGAAYVKDDLYIVSWQVTVFI